MLRLRKLQLEDFGPFKGLQSIDFPASGVTVIFGENMRGKTSLLNAIRYALFGKVIGRGSGEMSLSRIGNWESAEEGKYGFRVVLEFDVDGTTYELTRACRPRSDVLRPQNDLDFEPEVILRAGSKALGPAQRDQTLGQIMPEQVARFFLFDGELLKEYEELLRDESDMGRKISAAIERILGVPVLTNARTDLRGAHEEAQKQVAKAASRSKESRELGGLLEMLVERRAALAKELEDREAKLTEHEQAKSALDEELRKMERVSGLLLEKDVKQAELQQTNGLLTAVQERIKETMADSWRTLVSARAREVRDSLTVTVESKQAAAEVATAAAGLVKTREQAIRDKRCPVCLRPVDNAVASGIQGTVADHGHPLEGADDGFVLDLLSTIRLLGKFETGPSIDLIGERFAQLDNLLVARASTEDAMKEIDDQVRDFDQSEVRRLHAGQEQAVSHVALATEAIANTKESIASNEDQIKKAEDVLKAQGAAGGEGERARADLCQRLLTLFSSSIDEYRNQLRSRVERDASRLFTELTTEKDYAGLQINKNYGLTIMHKDGRPIPVRSAGAEHVVALSLMGALQQNAPLSGPIIMDSPFGRLDEEHTNNIVRALPSMAKQVLLLVYRAELDSQRARDDLGGNLKAEYRLVRRSARHTVFEKVTEP